MFQYVVPLIGIPWPAKRGKFELLTEGQNKIFIVRPIISFSCPSLEIF